VFTAVRFKIRHAISYADAFAAAADQQHATLVTGDRELDHLRQHIRVEQLARS
jgi:predicted nucleic acid-binding protein